MILRTLPLLQGFDNEPILDGKGRKLTVGLAAAEALCAVYPDDHEQSGESKVKRFDLARRLFWEERCKITIEEAALIKSYVARCYGPLVVGPLSHAIEEAAQDPDAGVEQPA